MKSLKKLGEFGLIEKIRRWAPAQSALKGIGDDAAVLPGGRPGECLCLTTDAVVEKVHFLRTTPAFWVGWKAMAINVSDVAAMGAKPNFAVVSLHLPSWVGASYVRNFYRGLLSCARQFGVELVGGNTVSSNCLAAVVTLMGTGRTKEMVYRSGARPGDVIFVTGTLGGSGAMKHLKFMPRLAESHFLVRHFPLHAMIDISDGLLQDLGHILKASKVGAEINLDKIPISHACLGQARRRRALALKKASTDGEDFELLFTLAPREVKRLDRTWAKRFRIPLTAIGTIIGSPRKLILKERGRVKRPGWSRKPGYRHF